MKLALIANFHASHCAFYHQHAMIYSLLVVPAAASVSTDGFADDIFASNLSIHVPFLISFEAPIHLQEYGIHDWKQEYLDNYKQ